MNWPDKLTDIKKYTFWQKLFDFSFVSEVIVFGSRAKNQNQARADIDIAINCPTASDKDWSELMNVIENADTLLKIDCVRFDTLSEQNELKQNIIAEGKTVHKK